MTKPLTIAAIIAVKKLSYVVDRTAVIGLYIHLVLGLLLFPIFLLPVARLLRRAVVAWILHQHIWFLLFQSDRGQLFILFEVVL